MRNELPQRIAGAYFILLGTLMYYFLEDGFYIPIFISYRQLFAVIIAVSGFVCFLISPKVAHGLIACRYALVLSAPMLVSFCFTLLIWVANKTAIAQITRSLSLFVTYSYEIEVAFAAAVFLYMFGEKGIWYNLLSMLLANLILIAQVMIENGVGVFMEELAELVLSFSDETGSVIIEAEFHELAFCTGIYVMFMLLRPKAKGWFWLMFSLTLFCFMVSLKRIGIVSVGLGLLIGWLLMLLCAAKHKKQAYGLSLLLMAACIVALFGYIYSVSSGLFTQLQAIGIDTKGRAEIYQAVGRFYELSPSFIGQGRGFVQLLFYGEFRTGQLIDVFKTFQRPSISSLHNDFLMFFIELGFFGYIAWLLSITVLRVWYFGRRGHERRGVITACLMMYVIVISLTDNTLQYPLIYMATDILIMATGFDEDVHAEEIRLFGNDRNAQRGMLE